MKLGSIWYRARNCSDLPLGKASKKVARPHHPSPKSKSMQPISKQQLHRNKYLRATSFEGKSDQGDSLRIPKGDRYHPPPQPMASVDGDGAGATGEISPESSFTTVILCPVTESPQGPIEMEEDSSSCSSPPTHPAFFQPTKTMAESEKSIPGRENVCPSSMAAPVSPSVSLHAMLKTRKSLNGTVAGGDARSVMLDRFILDGDGGEERKVLGNVDTNVLAALSNEKFNGDYEVVSLVLALQRAAKDEIVF